MTLQEMEHGFQQVWELIDKTERELKALFEDTAARFRETDLQIKATDLQIKENALEIKEMRRAIEESDRKFKQKMDESDERFNQKMAASDKKFKKSLDQKFGELTSKWGRFVEGLIVPAAVRMFTERGIAVDTVYQRVKKGRNGEKMEVDILAVNGEYAVLIEAKSTLSVDDIDEHLERLEKFTALFPEYKDRKVVGAVAGIVIDEGADKYAYRQGLFVIAQRGDAVRIMNDKQLQPKVW